MHAATLLLRVRNIATCLNDQRLQVALPAVETNDDDGTLPARCAFVSADPREDSSPMHALRWTAVQ